MDNIRATNQSQVTHRGLSYKPATVPREFFHCAKSFAVVWEEGPAEGLFVKYPGPHLPEIQNSTTPPYSPGDPIEAFIFNAYNQSEEIVLVSNQGLEVDDDMESSPNNVPLVYTPTAEKCLRDIHGGGME